jgi:S-formylglutathione hydrolase FrmB
MNNRGGMNKVRRFAFLPTCFLLSLLAFAPSTFAASRADCLSMQSRFLAHAVPYCVLLPPSYDTQKTRRYPVLYFLHGLGDNEQSLVNSGGFNLIEDLWEQRQLGEFLIVTPDGDRSFYINSRDGQRRYEDFLVQEFLPGIERRYRTRAERRYRGIAGVSMGGYGALRLALRYPELFGSVSAHSAMLLKTAPKARISGQPEETVARILGGVFGSPVDPAFWDRNSPFTLASNTAHRPLPRIYFDCGTEDDYGFNVGAQAFHDLLVSRGIPDEFHLYPGGHNWSYVAQHLAASLQFHSRAFGLGPS